MVIMNEFGGNIKFLGMVRSCVNSSERRAGRNFECPEFTTSNGQNVANGG